MARWLAGSSEGARRLYQVTIEMKGQIQTGTSYGRICAREIQRSAGGRQE